MKKKCSLGLHTRVKDKRNLIANLAYYYDCEYNIPYTKYDDEKKCEIFGIDNPSTDFITGNRMKGIGDHFYPLCADIKKKKIFGSDSKWNRIPVSGYNSKYKKDGSYNDTLVKWTSYVEDRGAKMFYPLEQKHQTLLNEWEHSLVEINKETFSKLCLIDINK